MQVPDLLSIYALWLGELGNSIAYKRFAAQVPNMVIEICDS